MTLRPYQQQALDEIHASFAVHDSSLGIMATGGGKTTVFSILADHCAKAIGCFNKAGRTLVVVNRRQLLRQTAEELHAVVGIRASLEQGENHANLESTVVVASIDTLAKRLSKYPRDHFSLLVTDEIHLMTGARAKKVMDYFQCKKLGVTATPTGKRKLLSKMYDDVAFNVPLLRLIKEGWLAPIVVAMSPLKIDLNEVKMARGDFEEASLESAITPYFDAIAGEMAKHPHRKWLCFLPRIDSSKEFAEVLNRHGFRAAHVDGEHDNTEILEKYKTGKLDVLTCSQLLSFGFNHPPIDGIVNLRQTKSIDFYEQLIGRGTRKSEDTLKHELLVLDFLWQYQEMGLVRPAFVLAKDAEESAAIQRIVERAGGPIDLLAAQEQAEKDIHAKLQETLRQNAKKRKKVISIMDLVRGHESDDLEGIYEHVPTYKPVPISQAQLMVLDKHGIDVDEVQDSEHAARIIRWLNRRIEDGKASLKQVALLARLAMPHDLNMSFNQASAYLDMRLKR